MYKGLNKELKSMLNRRWKDYPDYINAYILKVRRQDLGLTQKHLAEKFGVDRNTINRWENGLIKDENGETKDIPKWVELALQALEIEHAKEVRKLDREKKESESENAFVNSFFEENENQQKTTEPEDEQFIFSGFVEDDNR